MDWAAAMERGPASDETGAALGESAGFIAALAAASMHDARGLSRLCKCGAALDEKDEEGNGLIHLACEIEDEELVDSILEKYKDEPSKLDEPNVKGQTAIFVAARVGDVGIVKKLIHARCDPTRRDKTGFTPLHISATFGHVEICKLFLSQGCDAFTYDNERHSASNISEASWNRTSAEIKVLKGLEADIVSEIRKEVLGSARFLARFIQTHAAVLRKHFARPTYELAGALLQSLENSESSYDAARKARDMERQAHKMRKMRRPSYDPDADDSEDSEDEGSEHGGENGLNVFGAGPNGIRVSEKFTASYRFFDFLASSTGEVGAEVDEEAAEEGADGGGETGGEEGGDALGEGGSLSGSREGGQRPRGELSRSPSSNSRSQSEARALSRSRTRTRTKTEEVDETQLEMLRTFEKLRAHVLERAPVLRQRLGEERKKFGVLRDIITPGWRETRGLGSRIKKSKKLLEKERLTAERKKLVSSNKQQEF